jgi:hypothetical protein
MPFKPILAVLFTSFALSGCCSIGAGCNAPTASAPTASLATAWDGLGTDPSDDVQEIKPRRKSVRHHEIIVGPLVDAKPSDADASPGDKWARQKAEDQAADAKLSKQLKICSNC